MILYLKKKNTPTRLRSRSVIEIQFQMLSFSISIFSHKKNQSKKTINRNRLLIFCDILCKEIGESLIPNVSPIFSPRIFILNVDGASKYATKTSTNARGDASRNAPRCIFTSSRHSFFFYPKETCAANRLTGLVDAGRVEHEEAEKQRRQRRNTAAPG